MIISVCATRANFNDAWKCLSFAAVKFQTTRVSFFELYMYISYIIQWHLDAL